MRSSNTLGIAVVSMALGLAFGLGYSLEIKPKDVIQEVTVIEQTIVVEQAVNVKEVSLDRAKQFEGYEAEVYELRGKCHIGYGHLTDCSNGANLDEVEAYKLLYEDMSVVEKELKQSLSFYDKLPPNAKVVLMDMGLNMGVPSLLKFDKMLGNMELGKWWDAMMEIEDSVYYTQVNSRAESNIDLLFIILEEEEAQNVSYMF